MEDRALDAAFRRSTIPCKLDIKSANKKINSVGLQIADLVAYPISRHVINPQQENRAFKIVKTKLLGYPNYETGLKIFPLKSETPQQSLRQTADREPPIL